VVIPGLGGLGGAAGGHGPPADRGGVPTGSGPAGSRKQACVILDDDDVSSDEDEPLQKRLRQLSGAGPTVLNEAAATTAVADKEAVNKRAAEEAAAKRDAEERAVEEAAMKAATTEEVVGKTTDEAAGAAGGSSLSVAEAKRVVAPSGSTPSAKRPYMGVWKPWFVQLSLLSLFFSGASFSDYTFCPGPLPPA
jgi:pyruvate/2-oxoglutarate dehydrogenase complex dihydrolipoamide acyltransferase (E2) component